MLSADGRELASDDRASVEERVRRLVAETVGSTPSNGPLLDAQLDSLTLIAIVTRIEAAFAVELDSDELVALLGARDWSELAALVARKLAARHANLGESARNDGC
jgi:acyl carrier protein